MAEGSADVSEGTTQGEQPASPGRFNPAHVLKWETSQQRPGASRPGKGGGMLTAGHERQGGATGKERGRPEKLQRQGDGVSPGDSREPADTLLPPGHPFVTPASRAGR